MRIAQRTLLTVTAGLLITASAFAQGHKPTIGAVEVVIKDIASKEDIASVQPGGTVELEGGTRVRLIMSALPTGSARGPLYPATNFTEASSKGGVTITRTNAENSTADLLLSNAKGGTRTETIRYQITDTWVPEKLRTGSFTIRVVPALASSSGSATGTGAPGTSGTPGTVTGRAEQLTRLLYQGILLRDPDSGAQGSIDAIRRGGFDALVQAAVGIAQSQESRITLAATPMDQRLASMYQILLGISRDQADARQWQSDLNLLNQGRLGDVVSRIVQSDRFRTYNNLSVGVRY